MVCRMRFLWVAALLALVFAGDARAFVLSVGADWPPYNCRGENGEVTGVDVEMARMILIAAGLEMSIEVLPSPRGQAYLREGMVDVMPGATFNEERDAYAWFSVPYRDEVMAILVRKGEAGKWPLQTFCDVKLYPGLQIGVSRGAYYGKEFEDALRDGAIVRKLQYTANLGQRLLMLLSHRLDMVVGDKCAMLYLAKSLGGPDAFEVHPYVINSNPVRLMFSKKSVDRTLVDKVDEAIAGLKKSGKLDAVESSCDLRHSRDPGQPAR